MKLLLDTHIFLWALAEPARLSERRRLEVESPANVVYISAISVAEIMIKTSLGKLRASFDPIEEASKCGFEVLDFSGYAAALLGALPWHHRDPFDRMLIAQSIEADIPIMTDDAKFGAYGRRLI